MAASNMPWTLRTRISTRTAQHIFVIFHYASPIVLIAFFLIGFTAHSIITASDAAPEQPTDVPTGPGGKPLPQKKRGKMKQKALDFSPARKYLFNWLSVGTIATFVANAGVVILHAVLGRNENWWCGKSVAVSFHGHSSLEA